YWAVTDFVPALLGVKSQLPLPPANVIGQLAPVPSLTVTEPVGVPLFPATVTDTVAELPKVIGPGGTMLVIVVVVVSRLADAAKPSPARLATSDPATQATFKSEEIQRIKNTSPNLFIGLDAPRALSRRSMRQSGHRVPHRRRPGSIRDDVRLQQCPAKSMPSGRPAPINWAVPVRPART